MVADVHIAVAEASTVAPADAVGKLRLPHPYLTTFYLVKAGTQKTSEGAQLLRLSLGDQSQTTSGVTSDSDIILTDLCKTTSTLLFSLPTPASSSDAKIPESDNTPWARSRRAPHTTVTWSGAHPTTAQLWLAIYAIVVHRPELEIFRLHLNGPSADSVSEDLQSTLLAQAHPVQETPDSTFSTTELVVSRAAFWQGAGSPWGSYTPWTPGSGGSRRLGTKVYTLTTKFPSTRVHAKHPIREAKPTPGSVVYSRYIASFDSVFSMVALDWRDDSHVRLFNTWQNDPRVAAAWNERGTFEQHREYLRRLHGDKHSYAVLARFDETFFAYFEIFWAKEDHLGAHYEAGDFDRGRHLLVGDSRFRGPQRSNTWWPSIIHYCFLDDCRTEWVVGEPRSNSDKVLTYDYAFGLNVEQFVDFPYKRSVLVKVSREWFFAVCPLYEQGGRIMGTGLTPKI